jgi:tetratricopeptide (TPR) repeat protein
MYANQNRVLGRHSMAGLTLAALGLTSCATKTPALHSTPFFSPTATRQTTNAVDAGDADLEIASLRRTMMSRPEDVDARLRLAHAYEARGFPDVALEHYRLAAERFPDSVNAAVRLARALRKADQKEEALSGLKAFIHAHPQNTAEPYEWLGILNDDLQNWKASQAAYETALIYSPAASPATAELHNNLGYALLMQYQNNAAAAEFHAALRIKRDMVIARNNLGIALAGDSTASYTANHKEAILNWQAVSGPAAAHTNMAALLIERGDYPEARKELGTALGFDQQYAQAIFNLALVSERDGKPAVIPPPTFVKVLTGKTVKQPNALMRFFHLGRPAAKPTESAPLSAGRTAAPAVPIASGSGN